MSTSTQSSTQYVGFPPVRRPLRRDTHGATQRDLDEVLGGLITSVRESAHLPDGGIAAGQRAAGDLEAHAAPAVRDRPACGGRKRMKSQWTVSCGPQCNARSLAELTHRGW